MACPVEFPALAPFGDPGLPNPEDSGHQNDLMRHGPHVSCLLKLQVKIVLIKLLLSVIIKLKYIFGNVLASTGSQL
jgi:hypothetical protein